MNKRILLVSIPVLLLLLLLPPACVQRRLGGLYLGELSHQRAHADAVAAWALASAGAPADSPGSAFFDAEWSYGTCGMTVVGLGQVILEHPELRERYLPAMDACLAWLLQPSARSFGTEKWGSDGVDRPSIERNAPAEHAYLGYLNLALGVHRRIVPESRFAGTHDALSATLAASLDAPIHRFQTYPWESYPVDQAVVAGSVGLHGLATGTDHSARLADWSTRFRAAAVDPASGWLFQSLDSEDGSPVDAPRASGTALAAYALLWADPALSGDLYQALVDRGFRHPLGLGALREYPPGLHGGGDIDSGPVVFGLGVSATGFAMGAARGHGDQATYRAIGRTATLFGVPGRRYGGRWFHTGGAIGNAIMLAMLTAPRVEPR